MTSWAYSPSCRNAPICSRRAGGLAGELDRLGALASQFHVAFTSLGGGVRRDLRTVDLSPREKDCLRWTAQGKSSWDIGMILTISENTVNFHVKNAIRKLDATNRIVAVIKAIRLGLMA